MYPFSWIAFTLQYSPDQCAGERHENAEEIRSDEKDNQMK
jgi:hypothetical protein